MPILLPIASGKGGVGKSVIAANLAYQLARLGKTVILADMDWGGANAHTLLGIRNSQAGIGDFISNKDLRLIDLVVPLPEPHFFFLSGDGLIPGTANMSYFRKVKLLKELKSLTADYVILDLGAGTHFNTIDVFLACGLGFIVTSPEPTAILNAYSFIKTCTYRLLHAALPAKHPGRALVQEFFNSRKEPPASIQDLFSLISLLDTPLAERLQTLHGAFRPRIMVNMGKEIQELALGGRLRQVCMRHLEIGIEYIAFIPWDDAVRTSILNRKLIGQSQPGSPFFKAIGTLADKIASTKAGSAKPAIDDFSDLASLAEESVLS